MEKCKYQIIILRNNERIKTISSHTSLKNTLSKFNKIVTENKKVVFPIQHLNIENIEDVKYHIAIIKKKSYDTENVKLKNDYGQYVDHIVEDNDEWILYEKNDYYFEESFWVYGYHPRFFRKDFMFIYDNLLKFYAKNKYTFLNVYYYRNKVLFETSDKLNMVICKNKDDAVRMYCLLDDYAKKDKLKYVMFSGNGGRNRKLSENTINKIIKLTNWKKRKVIRYTT